MYCFLKNKKNNIIGYCRVAIESIVRRPKCYGCGYRIITPSQHDLSTNETDSLRLLEIDGFGLYLLGRRFSFY